MADQRWRITFHGGADARGRNNMHAYTLDGQSLGPVLADDALPHHVRLRELRGFEIGPDGLLYVANASKERSQILRFQGAVDRHGRHRFVDVFTEGHRHNSGLEHPFMVAFSPDGHLFVPSQDTRVVTRYFGPEAREGEPGAPMPRPPALRDIPADALHPGTFVPSERHASTGVRAIRAVRFGADGRLYVADPKANRIRQYDATTGAWMRDFADPALVTPIHLLALPDDGRILVGSRDTHAVLALDPARGAFATVVPPGAGGLRAPAGLAFGPDGSLYVASRTGRSILRFDPATGAPAGPFLRDLPDEPEFIALVD
jgi:DNA-binding beta-propeller fold protein YncE